MPLPTSTLESVLTASFNSSAKPANGGASQAAKSVLIVIVSLAVAGAAAVAGITFLALSIAFPIALRVADALHAYVSPSDIALATQLGLMWPLFAVAGVGFFVASAAILVKLVQHAAPAPAE